MAVPLLLRSAGEGDPVRLLDSREDEKLRVRAPGGRGGAAPAGARAGDDGRQDRPAPGVSLQGVAPPRLEREAEGYRVEPTAGDVQRTDPESVPLLRGGSDPVQRHWSQGRRRVQRGEFRAML